MGSRYTIYKVYKIHVQTNQYYEILLYVVGTQKCTSCNQSGYMIVRHMKSQEKGMFYQGLFSPQRTHGEEVDI